MSEYDAFLERIWRDLQIESDRGVSIAIASRSPLIPAPVPGIVVPPIAHVELTFFGMPVRIDNAIPVDELHIIDGTGRRRIVKIAEGT